MNKNVKKWLAGLGAAAAGGFVSVASDPSVLLASPKVTLIRAGIGAGIAVVGYFAKSPLTVSE